MLSLLPAAGLALAGALPASDFGSGDDGWTVTTREGLYSYIPLANGPFRPRHVGDGGDDGGYIETGDPDEHITFFEAPESMLGDRTEAVGGTIEWSVRAEECDLFTSRLVILASGGYAISALADTWPRPGEWTRLRVPLREGAWVLGVAAGQEDAVPAFREEIEWFLEGLDMLLIGAEASSDGGVTLAIDSVEIAPACAADHDADGVATVDDLLGFLAWFRAGDADHDGDGTTSVADLLTFLGDYRAGC